ncbi:type II secretion system protein [Bacillus sp. ISL-35]|uniref:type II secretion system protein n=1 Tax=Bacillus sp. ISL-35 TaxID=2819122 RepID=UPI001BE518FF|nr:type II secretion system protein [Bacillus sp. ISL-35]MBT2681654.1 type II secretion system protein [Bacillus sp. ISL-35]MBT2702310.1 type II secretion system protein [Chryseobacterium sp. ISL-80]
MLKTLKKRLKNQRGLTLVELLAVIVILGIIAAIAVPSIGGIIEKSKEDAAVADALQIIGAAKLAHAANPDEESWDQDDLKNYISNAEDEEFSVSYDKTNNVYSITGHDEALKVFEDSDDETEALTTLTEKQLIDRK